MNAKRVAAAALLAASLAACSTPGTMQPTCQTSQDPTSVPYGVELTLSRKSGHVDYAAMACPISSNLAGLMFPIVECLRIRL
jgi:hypothetical protein